MKDFWAAAARARELARQTGKDVYLLPAHLDGGWKFRHQDETIPSPILKDILEHDAEWVYWEAIGRPIDPTCEPNGDAGMESGSSDYRAYWSRYDG